MNKKRRSKRHWCKKCGHQIPANKTELAYITSKLLCCSECGRYTIAIAIDEVAGNLKVITVEYGRYKGQKQLVFERVKTI